MNKNMINDLTIITCSFNTPFVTENMLKSFQYIHNKKQKIILIENSNIIDENQFLSKNNIPFIVIDTKTHIASIDYAIKICKTRYALLIDTDIIFLKNIESLFQKIQNQNFTLIGELSKVVPGKVLKKRICPWFCFINIENVNKNNINFYDDSRLGADKHYDVGSSFFEDINNKKLNIGIINQNSGYFKHYIGMSWHSQLYNPNLPDTDIDRGGTHPNIDLYLAGLKTKEIYINETVYLKNVDIKNKFI